MRKKIGLRILVGLLIICTTYLNLKAQDTIPNAYSIHAVQNFGSWGDCTNGDPNFVKAYIFLYFEDIPIDFIEIFPDDLGEIREFNGSFKNTSLSKDLTSLRNNNKSITKVEVFTEASDIKNDKDLYYEFTLDELALGVN